MPYKIVKKGSCYQVVNKDTGKVFAKCTSKDKANKQVNLLHAIHAGWSPKRRSKKRKSKSRSRKRKSKSR